VYLRHALDALGIEGPVVDPLAVASSGEVLVGQLGPPLTGLFKPRLTVGGLTAIHLACALRGFLAPRFGGAVLAVVDALRQDQVAVGIAVGLVDRQRIGQHPALDLREVGGEGAGQLGPLLWLQFDRQGKFKLAEERAVGPLTIIDRLPVPGRFIGRPSGHVARLD
jgi:hypothetical protein